jgi:hypothetical protein
LVDLLEDRATVESYGSHVFVADGSSVIASSGSFNLAPIGAESNAVEALVRHIPVSTAFPPLNNIFTFFLLHG